MRCFLLAVGEHQGAQPVSAISVQAFIWLYSSVGPRVCSERRGEVLARWRGALRQHSVMEELKDTREPTFAHPGACRSLHVRLGEGDSTAVSSCPYRHHPLLSWYYSVQKTLQNAGFRFSLPICIPPACSSETCFNSPRSPTSFQLVVLEGI